MHIKLDWRIFVAALALSVSTQALAETVHILSEIDFTETKYAHPLATRAESAGDQVASLS